MHNKCLKSKNHFLDPHKPRNPLSPRTSIRFNILLKLTTPQPHPSPPPQPPHRHIHTPHTR